MDENVLDVLLMSQWEMGPLCLPAHCKLVNICLILHRDDLLESGEEKIIQYQSPRRLVQELYIISFCLSGSHILSYYSLIIPSSSNKPSQIGEPKTNYVGQWQVGECVWTLVNLLSWLSLEESDLNKAVTLECSGKWTDGQVKRVYSIWKIWVSACASSISNSFSYIQGAMGG